ncbi:MAG: triose-phosphate isomerase [Burkholderiaceae bacterium]
MTTRRKLVAANWKMNGSVVANAAWLDAFRAGAAEAACDIVVCAPYPYLLQVVAGLDVRVAECGAQDLSEHKDGAFTGEVAGEMLADVGARWVIVGHSERRQRHGETNEVVAAKTARALEAGLRPIVCVGEALADREQGRTFEVVAAQLAAVLDRVGAQALAVGAVAYEPVWAIGTGRSASPEQAQEVHCALRAQVAERDAQIAAELRLLYGGSVKSGNAAELFSQPDIDGGLIGGASLQAGDFLSICAAARN